MGILDDFKPAPSVNIDAIGRPNVRWRQLVSREGATLAILGYQGGTSERPRWFGYTRERLAEAPCNHCGQVGVFFLPPKTHTCPAVYDGVTLPCQRPHECTGQVSMSWHGVGVYAPAEWINEIGITEEEVYNGRSKGAIDAQVAEERDSWSDR